MLKYLLLDYVGEKGWPELSKEELERWLGAYKAYMQAMADASVLKDSKGLQPTATATTLRIRDGKTQVLDGPYADTKEQLGGFHLIEVADLDAALSWAARSPTALYGIVEAALLEKAGATVDAQQAYDKAIGLEHDPAVRRFLQRRRGLASQ